MLYRYLLCILPPDELAEAVDRIGHKAFPAKSNLRGSSAPVHITLFLLDMMDEQEEELLKFISLGLHGAQPITLHINGIKHFADERTIYADPVEKSAVLDLCTPVEHLVGAFADVHGYRVRVTDHPHLTIASGLKPAEFSEAWATLGGQPLEAQLDIGEVVLLKRTLEPGSGYAELKRFTLGQ